MTHDTIYEYDLLYTLQEEIHDESEFQKRWITTKFWQHNVHFLDYLKMANFLTATN
jgi:hypothetical protein